MEREFSKVEWLIIVTCIVLAGNLAYAEPGDFKPGSEPDGFRGIKWGQDISTVEGLVYVDNDSSFGGIDYYIREGDELKMGNAKLERIFYGFWKNKFSSVKILTKGYTNWSSFKAVVFEKFGEGMKFGEIPDYEWYLWFGENTCMDLSYLGPVEEGELSIILSETLLQQVLQQEKQERQQKMKRRIGWTTMIGCIVFGIVFMGNNLYKKA